MANVSALGGACCATSENGIAAEYKSTRAVPVWFAVSKGPAVVFQ